MSEPVDFNGGVIKEFRENEGKVGGPFEGAPMILVHHVGAKSGTERVAPLMYLPEDGKIYIFASKGGAPDNPAWFHNVQANPKITVEVGAETFEVSAKVIEDRAERDAIYAKQATAYPQFAEYETKTTRVIPVVELSRA
jgi:deazaflavin-dependent oxidoreductase (nitroreductase family)